MATTKFFYSFTDREGKISFLCTASGPVDALEKERRYRGEVQRGVIPAQEWNLADRVPGETIAEHKARTNVVGTGANRFLQRKMMKQAAKKLRTINGKPSGTEIKV